MWLGGWGEILPYFDNRVALDKDQKDQWGLPLVRINYENHENEEAMRKDIKTNIEEMLTVAGATITASYSHKYPEKHEMGTARMGRDPRTSVLNGYNQMHDVKNVFITDGSCMTSSGTATVSYTHLTLPTILRV